MYIYIYVMTLLRRTRDASVDAAIALYYNITSYYIILYHIILDYIILHYIISYYIRLHYIVLCYVMLMYHDPTPSNHIQ